MRSILFHEEHTLVTIKLWKPGIQLKKNSMLNLGNYWLCIIPKEASNITSVHIPGVKNTITDRKSNRCYLSNLKKFPIVRYKPDLGCFASVCDKRNKSKQTHATLPFMAYNQNQNQRIENQRTKQAYNQNQNGEPKLQE